MVKALDGFAHDVSGHAADLQPRSVRGAGVLADDLKCRAAAFRLSDESPAVRDRYGRTSFGQSCLLARRLIEAGVSFVTLNDRGTGPLGWDTHAQNFPTLKNTHGAPA